MGKVKSCGIQLKNEKDVYRPGETVNGVVFLEIEGELKIKYVKVFCKGLTLTRWKRTFQKSTEDDSMSTETYVNSYIDLFSSNPSTKFAPGMYTYNFRFKLPDQGLPSSFEGSLGATRYWLKVEVDKPFPSINDKFYRIFTVLAHIDINDYAYRKTASASVSKPLSKALGIGNVGTLSLTANLDRNGYCPGEHILISLAVNNESTKDLGRVKAHLIQRVDYRAASETDYTDRCIRALQGNKLEKGKKISWDNQRMLITAIPPSSKSLTCHIIKISYSLKVLVEVPLGLDLEIYFPITIGTAPLGTPIPSHARNIGENIFVTDVSRSIDYAQCQDGIQTCSKSCDGFPNLSGFKPLTVCVKNYNPVQALAKLKAATGGSATSGAKAAPVTKKPTAAAGAKPQAAAGAKPQAATATKPQSAAAPPKIATTTVVNTSKLQPAAILDSTANDIKDTSNEAAPPSYVEACSATSDSTTIEPEKGSILLLSFPCQDTILVHNCFKLNFLNFQMHDGKLVAFFPEIQFFPSEQTAVVLIQFGSQRKALSFLQNLTSSNTNLASRWMALVSENKKIKETVEDSSQYKFLHMRLMKKTDGIKLTTNQTEELKVLLKETFEPLGKSHDYVKVQSGKVAFANGDWSSYSAKAFELTFIVSKYRSLEQHTLYEGEIENHPLTSRLKELLVLFGLDSKFFMSSIDLGNISIFQDI